MTPDQAYTLAGDLVRDLAPLRGDTEKINDLCRRWLHVLGACDFGLVNAAAVRFIFADCLTTVPGSALQPGDATFTQPEESSA